MTEGISPYSGGTVPDLHRVPQPLADCRGEPSIPSVTARRAVSTWVPVLAWMAVIFALSSVPSLSSGLSFDYVLRKCAHMAEYAILFALLIRALGREAPAFALGVAYAISDEVHQHFVRGRHASPVDVAIDSVGLAIGLVVWRRLAR